MKKAILINIIIPVIYLLFFLLLSLEKLTHKTRYFVAENSSALLVVQLLISVVAFFAFKGSRVRVAIVGLYLVFLAFWYATAGSFNPL